MSFKAAQPSESTAPTSSSSRKTRRRRKAERQKAARSRETPRRAARARDKVHSAPAEALADPVASPAAKETPSALPEETPSALPAASAEPEPELELAFFDAPRPLAAPMPIVDDPELAPLTSQQLERRLRLRRQVVRLMAGLGTFSAVVTAIRVASLL